MIAAAQLYYVASFFLTVSVESLLEVAEHAAEHNKACSSYIHIYTY